MADHAVDPPGAGRVWSSVEAGIGWLAAQVFAILWATGVLSFGSGPASGGLDSSIWRFVLGGLGLWLGYLGVGALLSRRYLGHVAKIAGSPAALTGLAVSVVAGVACQLVVVPALYSLVGQWLDGDPEESARSLVAMVDSSLEAAALVVAVVVVAPLAEEVMYRGVLQRALAERLGTVGAVVVTSVIFAAAHGQVILVPGLFVFALVLGFLAVRFDGLVTPIVAHAAFNATTVVILLSG